MEMVWIGIDDTDSKDGGCTTYICYTIVGKLIENGIDIIGYPRLVRLNPNIPWKTRGNGAVAIRAGRGNGREILIGEFEGEKLFAFTNGNDDVDIAVIEDIVGEEVEKQAFLADEKTNPGFVITRKKFDSTIYEQGVKDVLHLNDVIEVLNHAGAVYKGYKNGRGLIGAAAAISWEPGDKTYELISYRYREKWGKERDVEEESVIKMDKTINSTFDNYDYEEKRVLITPNSPCPILFGIRGDKPCDLVKAKEMVISENYMGWMIYETNQGTDDHLQRKKISEVKPYQSVIIEGTVDREPFTIEGGHVIFSIGDETGSIDCTAYEPTKGFRDITRKLKKGDRVEVYGGVREKPFTINIEKIRIKNLSTVRVKVENPVCEKCGIHMKSMGKGKGYRCKRCGSTKDEKDAKYEILDRGLKEGFYEVPPCARRHLSKPLKRMVC